MRISDMAKRIQPSLTRRLFDMAQKYDNVIDFTLGDPDYETPDYVKKAGCDAIMAGKTKYAANAGIAELRQVVAARIEDETQVRYDPDTEIQITVGAMEGLFLTLCCLVNPGDEVIIPSPHWVNYGHMTEILSGVPTRPLPSSSTRPTTPQVPYMTPTPSRRSVKWRSSTILS